MSKIKQVTSEAFAYVKTSLALRLLALFMLTGVASVAVIWLTLDVTFERHFNREIQPHLIRFLNNIRLQVGTPPDINIAKKLAESEDVHIIIEGSSLMWSSNRHFLDPDKFVTRGVRVGGMGRFGSTFIETGFYDERFMQRYRTRNNNVTIIMNKRTTYLRFEEILTTVGLIILLVVVLYWLIQRLFSPIRVIRQGVKEIGDGKFAHRLDINRDDEFGELATSVNKMADNIELMLEAKQQMLLAISHELRTPITRARLALSLMEESSSTESIEDDLKEMESLVQELLETERLKETHKPLTLSRVDINALIHAVITRYFANDPIELDLAEPAPMTCVDEKRISLVVKNIIKNALTARKSNGDSIFVKSAAEGDTLIVSVIDKGVGIADKDIPLLTEPFFRADSSRQRKTGGYGIGLYLIKLIIEAHQGRLVINSEVNVGTTVSVIMPVIHNLPNHTPCD